jgi:hypothetical protein
MIIETLLIICIHVIIGADTVALAGLSDNLENAARCFSILTSEKSYDFEAENVNQRNDFIQCLDIVIQHKE